MKISRFTWGTNAGIKTFLNTNQGRWSTKETKEPSQQHY
jgi:hypothetical protein